MTNSTRIYIDTEFTDLKNPKLLSIGIVCEDTDVEFYAEVNSHSRLTLSSDFVKEFVIPQFGRVPGAACSYRELCLRLAVFLSSLVDTLHDDSYVIIVFDYDDDWQLAKQALSDAGEIGQGLMSGIIPVNASHKAIAPVCMQAESDYFESQEFAVFSRHHALCDARALKIAINAAT